MAGGGVAVGTDADGAVGSLGVPPGLGDILEPTQQRLAVATLGLSFIWALAVVAMHHPDPYWRGVAAPAALFAGAGMALVWGDRYALSAAFLNVGALVGAVVAAAAGQAVEATWLATSAVIMAGTALGPAGAAVQAGLILGVGALLGAASELWQGMALQAGFAAFLMWVVGADIVAVLRRAVVSENRAWRSANEAMTRRAELKETTKALSGMYALLERTNHELEVARREAEEAREIKARFAANVSHELRTPLNLIMGFSRIMYRQPEVYGEVRWTPALRADVRRIYNAGRHLLGMIDDILDLSRIDAQRLPLKLQAVEPATLIEEAVATARGLLRGSAVTIATELPPDLPSLMVDRTRVTQVLLNLLNNAIRFTDEGRIRVTAATRDGELEVAVSDTGVGIPADDLSAIFDEFSQARGPITSGRGGTGLGLAVCLQFVQMHGGRIWAESEVGKGSIFRFSLPLPDSGKARSRLSYYAPLGWAPPLPDNRLGQSVIVIAPEEDAARMIARGIEGYHAIPVTSVEGLRQVVEAEHPAGVVLVRDPLVAEASPAPEAIWREVGRPDLGVIEWEVPLPRVAKRYLHVEAYLSKPVEMDDLVRAIRAGGGDVGSFLTVDDDAGFRSLSERVLSAAFPGAQIHSCDSAEEALAVLEEKHFDVLLLDLVMGGAGGVTLLRQARERELLDGTRVFVATGAPYVEELASVLSPRLRFSKQARPRGGEWFSAIRALLEAAPPDYSAPALAPAPR